MSSPAWGADGPMGPAPGHGHDPASPGSPGRRRMLTISLVGLLAVVVAAAAVGIAAAVTHGFRGQPPAQRQATIFSAQVGDCLDLTPNGRVMHVVSCATSHDAEVFGTFHLGERTWPGQAAIRQAAARGCSIRLSSYLNPQLSANLVQSYVYPGRQGWRDKERTVICEVRAASGTLTGSVRNRA